MVRRRYVLSVATPAIAGISGCLETFQRSSTGGTGLEVGGQTRAKGESREIVISELQEEFEYIPSNDTVRYPAKQSGGEVVEYGHTQFESWARSRAQSAAITEVENVYSPPISNRQNLWIERASEDNSRDMRIVYEQKVNENGSVVEEPSIDLQSVIHDTPESVEVTIEYGGESDVFSFAFYVFKVRSEHVWGTPRPE